MIYTLVSNPKLPLNNLVSLFKQQTIDDDGVTEGTCQNCGKTFYFGDKPIKTCGHTLEGLACSHECYDILNWKICNIKHSDVMLSPENKIISIKEVVADDPKLSSDNDLHTNSLTKGCKNMENVTSEVAEPKIPSQKRFCTECNGPAKGRGFNHSAGCGKIPAKPQSAPKRFCPECNGLAAGRGFSHTETCSQKTVKPVKSTETCPKCGGSKRGRGFAHKPDCQGRTAILV